MRGAKPGLRNVVPLREDIERPVPDAPEFMGDEARRVWDELAPYLVARGRLEPLHTYQFASYCVSVATFVACTHTLEMEGLWYETEGRNGRQQRKHPALTERGAALDAMRRDSANFGLSPVDELRMKNSGQGDLFGDLMKELKGETGASA